MVEEEHKSVVDDESTWLGTSLECWRLVSCYEILSHLNHINFETLHTRAL